MWLMNIATATASGTARTTASVAARTVPKARGAMYSIRLLPSGRLEESAVIAGIASTTRNSATPTSRARTDTPAAIER